MGNAAESLALPEPSGVPQGLHVAVIMDGNGRWAVDRELARSEGHRQGAGVVREIVEAAPGLGIGTLSLYAFSADNWQRDPVEVDQLMCLLRLYLEQEDDRCLRNGVRIGFLGRRDRIPFSLKRQIERVESMTAGCKRLFLRIAVDYSARDAILRAAQGMRNRGVPSRVEFSRLLGQAAHSGLPAPDVDLLIRTGGEQRLSDFLLWECAYAELYFTPARWPEFGASSLTEAVEVFRNRERRFGRVISPA